MRSLRSLSERRGRARPGWRGSVPPTEPQDSGQEESSRARQEQELDPIPGQLGLNTTRLNSPVPPQEEPLGPPTPSDISSRPQTSGGEQTLPIRTGSGLQSQPPETLQAVQELHDAVAARHKIFRLRAEIEAMNAEMAGLGTAADNPRKRAGSNLQKEGGSFASRVRHGDKARFSGRDFDELHRFDKR
jgi:hypothetical protein